MTARTIADRIQALAASLTDTVGELDDATATVEHARLERDNLMQELARCGWTNQAIANLAGISPQRVGRIVTPPM